MIRIRPSALVFLPLATILQEAFKKGAHVYFAALRDPVALAALRLTLETAFIVVPILELYLLIGIGRQFAAMITIHEYTDLFLTIIIGLGVIFEMPILGFLGFPPFAVECYVMVASVELAISRLKTGLPRWQLVMVCVVLIALLTLLDCWIYWEMDRRTVISYRG